MLNSDLIISHPWTEERTVRNSRAPQLAKAFPRFRYCKVLGSIQLNKGIIGVAISDGRLVMSPSRFGKDGNTPQVEALNPSVSKHWLAHPTVRRRRVWRLRINSVKAGKRSVSLIPRATSVTQRAKLRRNGRDFVWARKADEATQCSSHDRRRVSSWCPLERIWSKESPSKMPPMSRWARCRTETRVEGYFHPRCLMANAWTLVLMFLRNSSR